MSTDFPGLAFRTAAPKIVATDADLVLLCVPVSPYSTIEGSDWDYFVYGPRAQWLNRLATEPGLPHGARRLRNGPHQPRRRRFVCRRCSRCSAPTVRWPVGLRPAPVQILKFQRVDLQAVVSDWVGEGQAHLPLPRASDRLHHETGKTITIGGEHGTVAWVDLWRGIFFCDVLKRRPVLQGVVLPEPARANWVRLLRNSDPSYLRDVTISRDKGLIKYVELEFCSREELIATPVCSSYTDWLRNI